MSLSKEETKKMLEDRFNECLEIHNSFAIKLKQVAAEMRKHAEAGDVQKFKEAEKQFVSLYRGVAKTLKPESNTLEMIGKIASEPELKHTQNGKAYTHFSFSKSVYRGTNEKGEKQFDNQYFNIKAWGETAEKICNELNKGDKISIEGILETQKYNNKTYTNIVVNNFSLIKKAPQEQQQVESQDNTQQNQNDDFGMDIGI